MAHLRIDTGNNEPTVVEIDERPVVLGRSPDVDLQIADQRLSRHHCRIEVAGEKLIITDLGSSNGTFARGQRVTKVAIDAGEAFYIGKTQIVFNPRPGVPLPPYPGAPPGIAAPYVAPAPVVAAAVPVAVRGTTAAGGAPWPGSPAASGPTTHAPAPPVPPSGNRETQGSERSPVEGYQIFDRLGEGSMGTVYSARNLETGEICVLKTVRFDGNPKDAIFFIREAQMGIKLRHPNIVAITDFGESGGVLFLAMEYLRGGSLLERIKATGPLGNAEALHHLRQLADALIYAGKKKFVHRDIKPGNIMLNEEGTPKLADFGLAKLMAEQGQAALTKVGETRGTPIYMPPELLTHAADADGRADIYSLGATYYHALTGFHPFRASSVMEILRMVTEVEPQALEERNPAIHPRLADVIRRMMRKKRDDRYATAQDLADDLARIAPLVGG